MNEFIDWLSKYLGIEKNPTATIIVSLSVFCLGIVINELLKAIGRFRERRAIRELVRRNYLIFHKYLYQQSQSLKLFESLVTVKGGPNFNVYVRPCSALDNFKDISYSNSFKAFFVGFENIKLKGRIKRIQAFDNLYHCISTIRKEQEKMFPIIGSFKDEAVQIINKLNKSLKEAFEVTADVAVELSSKPPNLELNKWLSHRHKIYQACFSKGDPSDVNEVRKYFIEILDFETANSKPITTIMNSKEFWYYHKKIHSALGDIDSLNTLVSNTKSYCKTISDKFEYTAQDLKHIINRYLTENLNKKYINVD
ncbi:hypothetical protein FA048_06505 [Pedobacter polaris]|uniref:Uncharacterized protein n=1 Tax=Pedobacter polaris TaxID=2571273 RepID=A0A4U1CS66_9SPHI|nr:hypothetical protein [Pedobacter polaris]TKC09860.1 hypothetical protein FA048_06505 [Pedobacter polaris]